MIDKYLLGLDGAMYVFKPGDVFNFIIHILFKFVKSFLKIL
jgi:hypothetical protein